MHDRNIKVLSALIKRTVTKGNGAYQTFAGGYSLSGDIVMETLGKLELIHGVMPIQKSV
jgi:hypothetical protein